MIVIFFPSPFVSDVHWLWMWNTIYHTQSLFTT